MRKLLLHLLWLPLLTACTCTSLTGGGSGTNTGNAIVVGKIVDQSGKAVAGVNILLRPEGYLAAPPWESASTPDRRTRKAISGSDGSFTIDSVPSGNYAIEANDNAANAVLLRCSIIEDEPVIELGEAALEPYAAICGLVAVAPSDVRQYVQIYGMERCAAVDSTGSFTIDNLPEGEYSLRITCQDTTIAPVILPELKALSGETAHAPPAGWLFSKKIRLNTTAGGADIAGNVHNFPVLIRLGGTTFNFNTADANGADLRFSKSGTTILPYQIERWDAGAGLAEVWVLVDTIYGNDSTQSIIIHWGNPNVTDRSDGGAVFDPANGFQSVWHLSETAGTAAADGSTGDFPGIYRGALPAIVKSPTGIGQRIVHPDSDYVDMGDVHNPGVHSISVGVWIKPATFDHPQALIAKTAGDTPSARYGFLLLVDSYNSPHFNIASGGTQWGDDGTFEVSADFVFTDTTSWHYVFAVIDRSGNDRCKMYVDGIDRTGSTGGDVTSLDDVVNTLDLRLGTEYDNDFSFTGAIDEASLAFTARSADWVKLSYMNQKEQDALVTW